MRDLAPSEHTVELLSWLSRGPRAYDETIEVWKTSCPRLSTWDDAVSEGLVQVVRAEGGQVVTLTAPGRAALLRARRD